MRYKATLKRDGEDRIDLTEPKASIEEVLKALHNMKPSTIGTIKYDSSESEVKLMKGELEEKRKSGVGSTGVKYSRNWKEVEFQ